MDDRADTDGATERTRRRFRLENPGRAFGKLLAASVISLWLSCVMLVVVALASSEDRPTLTVTDFPVYAMIGSWVGIWASLLGYFVWSFRRLSALRDEHGPPSGSPLERTVRLLALTFEWAEDSDSYEKRVKLTAQSLLFGLIVLVGIPVAVISGER